VYSRLYIYFIGDAVVFNKQKMKPVIKKLSTKTKCNVTITN